MKTLVFSTAIITALFLVTASQLQSSMDGNPLPAPVTDMDYYQNGAPATAKVELGRLLFFDKILSGNKNIACATCHHPTLATGDGISLGFGEGASGLGTERQAGITIEKAIHERVPRNTPALFNLGAKEFTRMFHDGRVEVDSMGYYEGGFITPVKWKLPPGLDNVLAAQAMFPVTSPTEMAGQKGENPIADAISLNNAAGPQGAWSLIAARLQEIPEYVDHFRTAFPEEVNTSEDISMVLAANAIAAFEAVAFRADNSAFDQYLRKEQSLSPDAKKGMEIFYGKAQCASCHNGKFQTDHNFYAIGMPQIGPGKSDGSDATYWRETGQKAFVEDFGRGSVTVRQEDRFKFRTPSLRNVALTGPWGHAGAYTSLEDVVRHHLDPERAVVAYQMDPYTLPKLGTAAETFSDGPQLKHRIISKNRLEGFLKRDFWVQGNQDLLQKIATANELNPVDLTDREVDYVLEFLESLTDSSHIGSHFLIPERVPSDLPVAD